MAKKSRHKEREIALKILYQKDVTGNDLKEIWHFFCENYEPSLNYSDYAWKLVEGINKHKKEIDSLIQQYSLNWRLERMSLIDRNALRIAVYEMIYLDVPPKVSINEAIELGKRYGTEHSGAFINGILDAIYHNRVKNESRL